MSSPIGGFYLAAQQRQKQRQAENQARVPLLLAMQLLMNDNEIIKLEERIHLGEEHEINLHQTRLQIRTQQLESNLIQLDLTLGLGETPAETSMQQSLTVALNEYLSSLMAEDERYQLKVKITPET